MNREARRRRLKDLCKKIDRKKRILNIKAVIVWFLFHIGFAFYCAIIFYLCHRVT